MKAYLYIFYCITVISCKTVQSSKTVSKNLSTGKESCKAEILRLLENNKLYDDHITYIGSSIKDEIFYDKKSKEIPLLYIHKFQLTKDSLINYEFTLTSDAKGLFLIEYYGKFRDYLWLKEYANLLKNKEELNKLIELGIEHFGNNRFNISFYDSSFDIDVWAKKEMTRSNKNNIREIQKRRRIYQLLDKDRIHDKFMQQYIQKGIIVVPEMMQIINEVTIKHEYMY